jgi:2-isopropylmalate synthase
VDYTCLVEQRAGRELLAEATVKVEVAGEVLHTAADGNGPVNALDAALRKALRAFYPQLDGVHLYDYKVRILDGDSATAARTRVIIDSSDGTREWSTMGSDTNIIAASAQALADSLEYAIWKSGAELRRRDERHFTTASVSPAATSATGR